MIISIEDRKKFKKMLVWDELEEDHVVSEIVLFVNANGSCVSVKSEHEDIFLNGCKERPGQNIEFHLNFWDNCKPIPEPSTDIWSWGKAVVWCNKQDNIVTKKHLFTAPGFHFIKNINMKELLWNKLNEDGTYKYAEWRTFCNKDCLEE